MSIAHIILSLSQVHVQRLDTLRNPTPTATLPPTMADDCARVDALRGM